MVSIRYYIDIVENAISYGRVRTPRGDGNVLKITMQFVCVQLDDSGEVVEFSQDEVHSIPERRSIDRSSYPKGHSFSADQIAAGHNTQLLK